MNEQSGASPLSLAASNGHTALLTTLVESCGVDVDARLAEDAPTPLILAVQAAFPDAVTELVRLHANLEAKTTVRCLPHHPAKATTSPLTVSRWGLAHRKHALHSSAQPSSTR